LLVPFVARLGGTADTPAIEMLRAELMLKRTVAELMAPALARAGFSELADRCDAALEIGNRADAEGIEVVAIRLDAAKRAPEAAHRDGALAAA
jgi:hypothetical protein